jgi:hypothetical protein
VTQIRRSLHNGILVVLNDAALVGEDKLECSNFGGGVRVNGVELLATNPEWLSLPHEQKQRDPAGCEVHERVSVPDVDSHSSVHQELAKQPMLFFFGAALVAHRTWVEIELHLHPVLEACVFFVQLRLRQ